jgi:hypothetical protein
MKQSPHTPRLNGLTLDLIFRGEKQQKRRTNWLNLYIGLAITEIAAICIVLTLESVYTCTYKLPSFNVVARLGDHYPHKLVDYS